MKNRIAIVDGIKTATSMANSVFKDISADDLAGAPVKELLYRKNHPVDSTDELILENVSQPANAANIVRIIALEAGLSASLPTCTVQRNSGSISATGTKNSAEEAETTIADGIESKNKIRSPCI